MKTFFLILTALMIFSCNTEDDQQPTPINVIIYSQESYAASLTIDEVRNISEGDVITKIEASTNVGELRYEIGSQFPENAFKIDSQTGEVFVNSTVAVRSYHGYEFIVKIKIVNGEFQNTGTLTISIENDQNMSCITAQHEMFNALAQWESDNNMYNTTATTKMIEFAFSVSQNKSICSYSFPYSNYYNANTTAQIELTDDFGQTLFTYVVKTSIYSEWGEYYLLDPLYNMDVLLEKNKVYHLKISFNQEVELVANIYQYEQNIDIPFPIELGDLNIIGTNYSDVDGINQPNKALVNMAIGLVDE